MCSQNDFAHLMADEPPAMVQCSACGNVVRDDLMDDHAALIHGAERCLAYLPDGTICMRIADGADGACSPCRERGDALCPVCGQDNDPDGPGCSCYGSDDAELDDDRARFIMVERSRLYALSGLPLVEDALAFARSLR